MKLDGIDKRQFTIKKDKCIHPLGPMEVKFYGAKVRVLINKAREMLGYLPTFDFHSGMKLTEQWARWANLLDKGR